MKELERRIFVSEDIIGNEYKYLHGNKKNENVIFQYYNVKKDKEGKATYKTYGKALSLARQRSNDGRYKNYEFLISSI